MARLVLTALCIFVAVAGCGVLTQEEQILTDFFEASRLHDTTIVARMSSVTFNPRDNGIVQDFEIERVDRAGDGQSEIVTVNAQVREFSGRQSRRRLLFTLQRRDGHWFISEFR